MYRKRVCTVLLAGAIGVLMSGCGKESPASNRSGFASHGPDFAPLESAAAQGDASAQFLLGYLHYFGAGIPADCREIMDWYCLAVEPEYTAAMSGLQNCCPQNPDIPQDIQEAIKWLRAAASQGHAGAELLVGTAWYAGFGVPQNDKEAVKWLSMAAEHGHAGAQALLGRCYYFGNGVEKDYVQAYAWISLAAERGFSKAAEEKSLCAGTMTVEQIDKGQRLAREYAVRFER